VLTALSAVKNLHATLVILTALALPWRLRTKKTSKKASAELRHRMTDIATNAALLLVVMRDTKILVTINAMTAVILILVNLTAKLTAKLLTAKLTAKLLVMTVVLLLLMLLLLAITVKSAVERTVAKLLTAKLLTAKTDAETLVMKRKLRNLFTSESSTTHAKNATKKQSENAKRNKEVSISQITYLRRSKKKY
jgi:hypothetical protein